MTDITRVESSLLPSIRQQVVERMEQARSSLAEARTLDEIKSIHDALAAVLEWGRRQEAVGIEVVNEGNLLRLEAQARMAEALKGGVRHTTDPRNSYPGDTSSPPTHQQLGVTRVQAERWRKVASVSPEARQQLAAEATSQGRELTQKAIISLAKKQARPEPRTAAPLPKGKFSLILADPPWKYDFMAVDDWAVENTYPTLTLPELAAMKEQVQNAAVRDCVLFLWTTAPKLADAIELIRGWGFEYKTGMVWVKHENQAGMGWYSRVGHEHLLIATQGKPGVPEAASRPPSVIRAAKGKHSEKPPEARAIIEQMYPDASRLELFARGAPPEGWTFWGNEAH